MAMTDLLAQLRETFPEGGTAGTFDAARVEGGRYAPLLAGLGVPTALPLTSPTGWRLVGDEISLTGRAACSLLGLADALVYLRFTPSGEAGSGGGDEGYTLVIDLALPAGWTFGQSFALLGGETLAGLVLADPEADPVRRSALIIASAPATDPIRIVDGAALAVPAGLSFLGFFEPNSGTLAQVAWIVSAVDPVTGPIGYEAATGAVELDLPLAHGSVPGLFGSAGPQIDVTATIHGGLDVADQQHVSGIRFSTTVDFGGPVELSALLSDADEGVLELAVSDLALALPSPERIAIFFGAGNGIVGALPGPFSGGHAVVVDALVLGIGIGTRDLRYAFLQLAGEQPWKLWPGVIELAGVRLLFSISEPMSDEAVAAFTFTGVFTLGIPIMVQADLPGTVVQGSLPDDEIPDLTSFVRGVFGSDRGVPTSLTIRELDFSADLDEGFYSAAAEVDGEWSFDVGVDNTVVFEDLRLELAYDQEGGPSGEISGAFSIGESHFAVTLDLAKSGARFLGVWERTEEPLTFQDIAIELGLYGLPTLPDGIDLGLTGAEFVFDSAAPSFAFTLTTTYGDATLVAGKDGTGAWGFVYGMIVGLDLRLDLTDIDLLGHLVPSGSDVLTLRDLRIVAATRTLPSFTPTTEQRQILGEDLNSGLVLAITLQVGSGDPLSLTARFGGADDGTATDVPPPDLPAPPAAAAGATAGPQVAWVDVQRAFGPVYFRRLGVAVSRDGGAFAVLLDASVALGGLTIGLTGLEATVPLGHGDHRPGFDLAGLEAAYVTPGLALGGGLARVPETGEYTGELIVRAGRFGATALGSYSVLDGTPSLFAFVFVDVPLGGPPFFYVTGLAGGFGYNRSLRLPGPDEVAGFPLVRGAMGELDADRTRGELQRAIEPAANQSWAAAGVRFTSFQMLRSFALLTVAFGTHVEVGLVGQSTLTIPARVRDERAPATAEADLQLVASVAPDNGQLAVQAQLTPRSYVFNQKAHLTGGFAFFAWFAPSRNAGDFVVTLGGYHPLFDPPPHYPTVPRLGLNWQVSDDMTFKGSLYFALTPSVIMAGGSLEATWHGGNVTAWFTADADFLIRFKPFGYTAHLGVGIGVSVVLAPKLTTKAITVRVGVALDLWGPPFGGRSRIDIAIVSVTIAFGSPRPADPPDLDWYGFRTALLPPANQSERDGAGPALGALGLAANEPTPTDSIVTIAAAEGLLGTAPAVDVLVATPDLTIEPPLRSAMGTAAAVGDDGVDAWLVDPAALRLSVDLRIPCVHAVVAAGTETVPDGVWNTEFGIGPMGVAPGELDVRLRISIARSGPPGAWSARAVLGAVPTGLWLDRGAVMRRDGRVDNVLTGVDLVPVAPEPNTSLPVPVARLLGGDPELVPVAWSDVAVPGSDPFDQDDAMGQLQRTLTDPPVAARRTALLGALAAQDLGTATSVDVAGFAAAAPGLLTGPPRLRLLGESAGRNGGPGGSGRGRPDPGRQAS